MKKMIILALIVGMASLATAGLILDANSGVVKITGGTEGYGAALGVSAILAPVVDLAPGVPATFSSILGYGSMNPADAGLAGDNPSFVYEIGIGGDTGTPLAAGDHLIITTNAFGFGLVDMGLGSINFLNMVSGETLSAFAVAAPAVPEPMTMALLGLGGLFLRRRK